MKAHSRIIAWLSGCICLILLTSGVFFWYNDHSSISAELTAVTTPPNLDSIPTATAENAAVTNPLSHPLSGPAPAINLQHAAAAIPPPPLAPVAYPVGSIGEACEVNKYPPYHLYFDLDLETRRNLENSPFDYSDGVFKQNKNMKCLTAVETYMNTINPNLWSRGSDTQGRHSGHALVAIDNPLTFARIFADPAGDFAKVQEALARPECQLGEGTKSNWQLKETCHAEAIHNYALIKRFCGAGLFISFIRPSQNYSQDVNLTPEEDRGKWIESLQRAWVLDKCKSLKLQLRGSGSLETQIQALHVIDEKDNRRKPTLVGTLIDLAARLGDEAAALTYPIDHGQYLTPFDEEGYKYGPLAEWFSTDLTDPTNLFSKLAPSVDRLRQFVSLFGKNIKAKGKLIKINHAALVQHLCSPPYYTPPSKDTEAIPEPPSCRTVANELRQEFHSDKSMLKTIATFEEIAMRLDVYE